MDLGTAGRLVIYGALGFSLWSAVASAAGYKARDRRAVVSGRRALYGATVLIGLATILLVVGLLVRDFSILYVANYTSLSTPAVFAITSLWAGMEGSLLFWTLVTSIYAVTAIYSQKKRRADLTPLAASVLAAILAFFAGLLSFAANPFSPASPIPVDGAGLNPLLQSPFMTIHPVLLYLGLTGFAVPFAFAIAALLKGRLDYRWFTSTRRWTVLSWSFLSVGILLGAAWAYSELGWGGYWAWDPVENASFLPWLTGTAFLHSVMIQERRGMLKIWNVALILSTYGLAIFGTFLTRSGLLSSVHTFSESPVGSYFLPFLALLLVGAFGLLAWRLDRLRADKHLDSMLSRESMFLFNNLLFVAIAFTVLWGTVYPIVVEAINGAKVSVGPPFFNSVVAPIGLALLALCGIGPLVAWRRASVRRVMNELTFPLIAGSATIVASALIGLSSWGALLAFGLCAFVAVAMIGEFVKAAKAHAPKRPFGWLSGLAVAVGRNHRRYGGYIVHLGVVLIFLGLSGSALKSTWSGSLQIGDSFQIGKYKVTYRDAQRSRTDEKMVVLAVMDVTRNGRRVGTLTPQRNFHIAQQQPQSEVGIRTTPAEDLYIVLTQMDESGEAIVRAWVTPLVMWIWIGGAVMAAGMVVILTGRPAFEEERVPVTGRKKEMVSA